MQRIRWVIRCMEDVYNLEIILIIIFTITFVLVLRG